jgi:hypothetical protein
MANTAAVRPSFSSQSDLIRDCRQLAPPTYAGKRLFRHANIPSEIDRCQKAWQDTQNYFSKWNSILYPNERVINLDENVIRSLSSACDLIQSRIDTQTVEFYEDTFRPFVNYSVLRAPLETPNTEMDAGSIRKWFKMNRERINDFIWADFISNIPKEVTLPTPDNKYEWLRGEGAISADLFARYFLNDEKPISKEILLIDLIAESPAVLKHALYVAAKRGDTHTVRSILNHAAKRGFKLDFSTAYAHAKLEKHDELAKILYPRDENEMSRTFAHLTDDITEDNIDQARDAMIELVSPENQVAPELVAEAFGFIIANFREEDYLAIAKAQKLEELSYAQLGALLHGMIQVVMTIDMHDEEESSAVIRESLKHLFNLPNAAGISKETLGAVAELLRSEECLSESAAFIESKLKEKEET